MYFLFAINAARTPLLTEELLIFFLVLTVIRCPWRASVFFIEPMVAPHSVAAEFANVVNVHDYAFFLGQDPTSWVFGPRRSGACCSSLCRSVCDRKATAVRMKCGDLAATAVQRWAFLASMQADFVEEPCHVPHRRLLLQARADLQHTSKWLGV